MRLLPLLFTTLCAALAINPETNPEAEPYNSDLRTNLTRVIESSATPNPTEAESELTERGGKYDFARSKLVQYTTFDW